MKNTPTQMLANALKKQIEEQEKELQAKKEALKQIEMVNKPSFIETSFGKKYTKMICALTSPFAKANKAAELALDDPEAFKFAQIRNLAEPILKKLSEMEPTDKKAKDTVITAAKIKLALESFSSNPRFDSEVSFTIKLLKNQIERLRPEQTPEAKAQLAELANKMADEFEKLGLTQEIIDSQKLNGQEEVPTE